MNTQIKLKDLYVGWADGETEANSAEHDFTDLFYTGNSKVEEIMKPESYIVSGRKGTGKTILAKYVEVEQTRKKHILISRYIKLPDDIKQDEFIESNYTPISEDEYNLFPKFYVLKTMIELILNNKVNLLQFIKSYYNQNFIRKCKDFVIYKKSCKNLKKIYEERYPTGNFITQGLAHSTEIQKEVQGDIKSDAALLGGTVVGKYSETTAEQKEMYIKNYSACIDEMEKLVMDCTKIRPIMLIFDDIDDIKKYMNDELKLKKFLIGMIKCVKEVNNKMHKNNVLNKCILIIRDDIIQTLNFFDNNLNKIIIDSEVNLDWVGNNQTDMLIDMILHKISVGNELLKNKSHKEILKLIFSGNKSTECRKKMQQIINAGFGRPRDVITYMRTIIKNNKDADKIDFRMIRKSRNEYSNAFWNELKNELFFHYSPEIITSIEKILGSLGKKTFEYAEIKEHFENNKNDYERIKTLDDLLDIMYHFGIIGTIRRGEEDIQKVSFAYRKDGKNKLEKNDLITVHFGLRKAFNL